MNRKIALITLSVGVLAGCNPKSASSVNESSSNASSKPQAMTSIDVSYMDKSVRPQDDFFQFANGTWCKNNPVPASESRWGSFNELDQRNKTILKDILNYAAANDTEKGSQNQLLGDYYTSYTDMATRNSIGSKPLEERLKPILNMKARTDLVYVISEMHRKGINCLFSFGIGQDLKDPQKNVAYFEQSGIGLPNKDFYFKENKEAIRKQYRSHMIECFVLYGDDHKTAEKRADNAYNMELMLAQNMMDPAELRLPEKTYNARDFHVVTKLLSNFNIERYLTIIGCSSLDSLIVGQPAYLEAMNRMIEKADLDQWSDYLTWCTINHYAGMMDDRWVDLNFSFYSGVLKGTTKMKPIEERCIDEMTRSALSELLGKAFVGKAFSEKAKERVNGMVDNLLEAFRMRINQLDWMTPATKKEALRKLNAIGRKLGFPDEWKDYKGLMIDKANYISNVDNCVAFSIRENLDKLHKPVNKKEWEMPAHLVNAYYHPLLNEIVFPAGIMQPPFFDEHAEDAVNYGRIGMVIGHEFTHGFDDNGSKFAADGSYTNWWSETDRKSFEERTTLLGNTFGKFCPFDGDCVNPDLTMGENIADLGGLTMAYYAYTMTHDFKKNIMIDGFTPAQRFFIAYAQLWKINYTDAELKNRIATDPHSPGMYRVNGPLMNCPEFFKAFDVQPGDKMRNPDAQVSKIW